MEFLHWLTAPEQVQQDSMLTGHLPTRAVGADTPGFTEEFGKKFPGNDVFAENLANVKKARPGAGQRTRRSPRPWARRWWSP